MISSQLNTYQISDFIEWHARKQLDLNPDFQRRSVWSQPARVFLIDTILRELSLPKFYIRTNINLETKKSVREVVDGQQRLRAILDFANDEFTLTKRASEFAGYTYSTLPEDLKQKFLAYTLAVEHLINASDSDVLEVFSRLNSYGVTLNPSEKRHANYQGELKWAVHSMSRTHRSLWDDYNIIGIQQWFRMADDETIAELYGIMIDGVKTGGSAYLNKLYSRFDQALPDQKTIEKNINSVLKIMTDNFSEMLMGPIGRKPHFIMFFAAVAHSKFGIARGEIEGMPRKKGLLDFDTATASLGRLVDAMESDDSENLPEDLNRFRSAARSSTQTIKSRQVRFKAIYASITK